MLRISCNINWGHVTLHSGTQNHKVPVCRKDGSTDYVDWCGFIDLAEAQNWKGAIPVKIAIDQYALDGSETWVPVEPGEYLQGCLAPGLRPWERVVYGVTVDGAPRLVSRTRDNTGMVRHRVAGRTLS